MNQLIAWKSKMNRKPLIIEGARQVGKTWLMKEFGRSKYQNVVYINFERNMVIQQLFSQDLDVHRILRGLEVYSGQKIKPDDTLIIFDEVQEVPAALTSLKYFCEMTPEYHIVCAGSLLGIALHSGTSFPVGKTEFLKLGPMTFLEFLYACGLERYAELIQNHDIQMISAFRQNFVNALKQYYFVGGMPEAVAAFSSSGDYNEARKIQQQIIAAYEQDFSKHAPAEVVPRIRSVFESIPSQLAKENKKFIYGLVREGARAREYETALMWLSDCGLVHKVSRVNAPSVPLKAYQDLKAYKLYLLDIGLLGCMSGLTPQTLLDGNTMFAEFKGALTEQYVLQQMKADSELQDHIYYYTNERNTSEIDFLIDPFGQTVPLEVRAEQNLRARSLQAFRTKFQIPLAVRTSMADFSKQEGLINLPLYMESELADIIQ